MTFLPLLLHFLRPDRSEVSADFRQCLTEPGFASTDGDRFGGGGKFIVRRAAGILVHGFETFGQTRVGIGIGGLLMKRLLDPRLGFGGRKPSAQVFAHFDESVARRFTFGGGAKPQVRPEMIFKPAGAELDPEQR